MNLTMKRLLILFSVSLNIGFVAFTAYNVLHKPPSRWQMFETMFTESLAKTSAPPEALAMAWAERNRFADQIFALKDVSRRTKLERLELFAAKGPLEMERMQANSDKHMSIYADRDALLQRHFLNLREILGDEQSVVFFTELHARLGAKYENH